MPAGSWQCSDSLELVEHLKDSDLAPPLQLLRDRDPAMPSERPGGAHSPAILQQKLLGGNWTERVRRRQEFAFNSEAQLVQVAKSGS